MALVSLSDKSLVKEKTITNSFFDSKLHPDDLKITLLGKQWTLITNMALVSLSDKSLVKEKTVIDSFSDKK